MIQNDEPPGDDKELEDRDMMILRSHAAQLAEHFESVQIIVTSHRETEGGTLLAHFGAGNFYARYGGVKSWLKMEEGRMAYHPEPDEETE